MVGFSSVTGTAYTIIGMFWREGFKLFVDLKADINIFLFKRFSVIILNFRDVRVQTVVIMILVTGKNDFLLRIKIRGK